MKLPSTIVLLGLLVAGPVSSQENPPAPPPAMPGEPQEKISYIGVATAPVPPPLTAQLKLSPGFGLLVTKVVEDSPAAAAGLEENDVLVKLDDQQLIDPNQLAVLVRSRKPDEEIALTFIRGGETKTATVKIGKRSVPRNAMRDGMAPGRHKMMFFGKEPGFGFHHGPGAGGEAGGPGKHMILKFPDLSESRTILSEDDKRFELRTEDGEDVFVVSDTDEKEIFRGEIGSPEQREKVPQDFRGQLEKLETIRVKVPPPADPPLSLGAGAFSPDFS